MPAFPAIAQKDDTYVESHCPILRPREGPYSMQEIGEIMKIPPLWSLSHFLIPSEEKKLQPPRYCYGWVIPDFWYQVWAEGDPKLMEWTQIKKQKKREEELLYEDEVEEEWDPHYDDYVSYYVCVPDEKRNRINVARNWAERAKVKVPLYDAPIVKVMANGKAHYLFALYDNYTLSERPSPEEVDAIRDVWSVNKSFSPMWYPVLPVDGQDFRWTMP